MVMARHILQAPLLILLVWRLLGRVWDFNFILTGQIVNGDLLTKKNDACTGVKRWCRCSSAVVHWYDRVRWFNYKLIWGLDNEIKTPWDGPSWIKEEAYSSWGSGISLRSKSALTRNRRLHQKRICRSLGATLTWVWWSSFNLENARWRSLPVHLQRRWDKEGRRWLPWTWIDRVRFRPQQNCRSWSPDSFSEFQNSQSTPCRLQLFVSPSRRIRFSLDSRTDSKKTNDQQRSNALPSPYEKVKNSLICIRYVYEEIKHSSCRTNYTS